MVEQRPSAAPIRAERAGIAAVRQNATEERTRVKNLNALENRLRLSRCPSWAGQQINRPLACCREREAAAIPCPLKRRRRRAEQGASRFAAVSAGRRLSAVAIESTLSTYSMARRAGAMGAIRLAAIDPVSAYRPRLAPSESPRVRLSTPRGSRQVLALYSIHDSAPSGSSFSSARASRHDG